MPRYYCDYCDTFLTHDSPAVRKQHNAGYKHKANVREYYEQFEEKQTQSLIDQRIREQLAAGPMGGFPPGLLRPGMNPLAMMPGMPLGMAAAAAAAAAASGRPPMMPGQPWGAPGGMRMGGPGFGAPSPGFMHGR